MFMVFFFTHQNLKIYNLIPKLTENMQIKLVIIYDMYMLSRDSKYDTFFFNWNKTPGLLKIKHVLLRYFVGARS